MSQMQAQESFLALLAILLNESLRGPQVNGYDLSNQPLPPILEAFRTNFPPVSSIAVTPPTQSASLQDHFRSRHSDYTASATYYPSYNPSESSYASRTQPPSADAGPLDESLAQGRERIRESISRRIETLTHSMDGLRYGFGNRSGSNGKIDCSGFVAKAVSAAVTETRQGVQVTDNKGTLIKASLDSKLAGEFNTTSEGQLAALLKRDLKITTEATLRHEMRGGMVIAMDTGHKGWDAGRRFGIDHVVVTYEDKNGQVWVAQSSSSTPDKGVSRMRAEDWIREWESKGAKLYAVDLVDAATITLKDPSGATMVARADAKPTLPGLNS